MAVFSADLVLPAHVRWVHHAVAPVLLLDLALFVSQEGQLLVAALHVLVHAVQVVTTPLGVVLKKKLINHIRLMKVSKDNSN